MATDEKINRIEQEVMDTWYKTSGMCVRDCTRLAIWKGIEIGEKEGIQIERQKPNKYKVFYDHIKAHLKSNQEVICKICGKSAKAIWEDFK